MMLKILVAVSLLLTSEYAASFTPVTSRSVSSTFALFATQKENDVSPAVDRRTLLSTAAASIFVAPSVASAASAAVQDSMNVDNFLRTGADIGGNMGVSSQAGKSRPQTGVVLRDGSDVLQDSRSGDVLAEILTGTKAKPVAVIASFASPWALQTGSVFDVECRDSKSGNGAFLAVSESVGGKSLAELPSSFFLGRLFDPTGRFSFYGPPTDVKVKKSTMIGTNKRLLEITFSILSQSTNSEIGRHALLVATIPEGTDNAVMLTASGLERRWKKDVEEAATKTIDSFRALPAPKTNMKLRAKDRGGFESFE